MMEHLKTKEEKAIHYCYCELFKHAAPSADFNELLKNAKTNDLGQKEIPFDDYEIEQEKLDEIIQESINKFKLKPKYKQQLFRNTIYLGCSPRTKNNSED